MLEFAGENRFPDFFLFLFSGYPVNSKTIFINELIARGWLRLMEAGEFNSNSSFLRLSSLHLLFFSFFQAQSSDLIDFRLVPFSSVPGMLAYGNEGFRTLFCIFMSHVMISSRLLLFWFISIALFFRKILFRYHLWFAMVVLAFLNSPPNNDN